MCRPPKNNLGGKPLCYQRLTAKLVSYEGLSCYSSTAACAAAKRAIGTRNGEQLT